MAPCQKLDLVEVRPHGLRHLHAMFARYFIDVKYPGQFSMDAVQQVWAPLLDRGVATIRVAMLDGYTVGVSGVTYMQDTFNGEQTATMVFFWVDPLARGHGVGKAMLEQAERDSRAHGCTNIVHGHMFTVEKDGGRGMFERRGYEVVELGFRKRL